MVVPQSWCRGGDGGMNALTAFDKAPPDPYSRAAMPAPLRLTVDLDALAANWRAFARAAGGAACGAAVKADAYGLGARGVVERLAREGCRDFFVATWDEAAALGALPAGCRLAVLHGLTTSDVEATRATDARPVLNTPAQAALWREVGDGRSCDAMVDTGMNRLGLAPAEAGAVLAGLALDTLHGHLACADEPGHPMNERQRSAFAVVADAVPAQRRAFANSAGVLLGESFRFDLVRPGLGLYGGCPSPLAKGLLRPVARPSALVLQVREVEPGDSVGYGATWIAARPSRIAVVNLGYADGYLRAFGAGGRMLAGGVACPIVGRVSMDLTAVDVTDADVIEGDWLDVDYDLPTMSAVTGLSQYELLTSLGSRYERRYA